MKFRLLFAAFLLALTPIIHSADGILFNTPKQTPFGSGAVITGAQVFFYTAGTTTKQNTYTTAALSVAHANPVIADADGKLPAIFLDPVLGDYKVVITTAADSDPPIAAIDTVDNYPSGLSQAQIGLTLYPIIASETSAGVTPTNFEYEPGDVRRYGGIDDGTTDNATAITNLGLVMTEWKSDPITGGTARFPGVNGYAIASAVTLPNLVNIEMEAPIIYTGSSDITALTIGAEGAANLNRNTKLRLRVRRSAQSDWTSTANIGIHIYNASNCEIHIDEATKFTIGAKLNGAGAGWLYNTVYLGDLRNNRYGIKLTNETISAVPGAQNENVFIGGRFSVSTGVNTSTSRFGVWITSEDGTYTTPNNNVFIKPNFEMNADNASADAVGVWAEYGRANLFWRARNENNDYALRTSNSANLNTFVTGAEASPVGSLDQLDTSNQNLLISQEEYFLNYFTNVVARFNNLGAKAHGTSNTDIVIPGLIWASSGSATRTVTSSTSVTYDAATGLLTVPSTRGVGLYVDTSTIKEFIVDRSGTAGGRVEVTAYDSGDAILSGVGVVVGTSSIAMTEHASFGGAYRTGSDTLLSTYFKVNAATQYVFVFIAGGDSSAVITSFAVKSLPAESQVGSWTTFDETGPHVQNIAALDDTGTPSVSGGSLFETGGTTAITDFDDGVAGQTITIKADHSVTITDGAPVILAGGANFGMVSSDTLVLTMFDDQVWQEVSRSVN